MQSLLKYLIASTLIICSCNTNEKKSSTNESISNERKQQPTKTALPDPNISDTLLIDELSVVFYHPDSIQIEKQMKLSGEENFRAGMDDYLYYMNESLEFLKKKGLPLLDARDKKYLKFKMTHGQFQLIKLDSLDELWGIYFFEPNKKPYLANMTEIEDDYKHYFRSP